MNRSATAILSFRSTAVTKIQAPQVNGKRALDMKSRFLVGATTLAAVIIGPRRARRWRSAPVVGCNMMHPARWQERRSKPAGRSEHDADRRGPGDYRFSFVHDGLTREYLVRRAAGAIAGAPTAMLLALHGGGGDADYQADDFRTTD